jgi:hypothetical protein
MSLESRRPPLLSCCSVVDDLEHEVSRMDDIIIWYGVEVISLSPTLLD